MQFLQTEFPLVIFSPLPSLQAIQSKQLQIKTEHKNCHGAMKSKALVSSMFAGNFNVQSQNHGSEKVHSF